jgi:alpha-tubulin suppressor-like RCC1 family protein
MRKYIYSIIALLMVTLCSAQLYVSQAEYFWDNDPGTGNGTPVLATDGNLNSAFEYLTKTGISTPGNGLHKFCLRVKDNTGVWGPVFTNIINVQQNNTSTIMAVSQAEYFWDTDPGTGNGTPVLATDGNFDSTYEQLTKTGITLPSAGLHVFNIRVKDNSGVWGPVFKNVINVQSATVSGCYQKIAGGAYHNLAIKSNGTLWTWGHNANGALGDGTTIDKIIPTQIGNATNWKYITAGDSVSFAIKTDGTLWGWGLNEYGGLGDGTTVKKLVPTQIGVATNWKIISNYGSHSVAIKEDGTLWAWGYNGFGQLGDGTTINRYVPVQIGTANNWETVSTGSYHTVAIKSDGTLWAWGYNLSGQLGFSGVSQYLPIQVGSANNWKSVNCGDNHTLAIKTDGTLWSWGGNDFGQLGNGSYSTVFYPIQIGTANNWKSVEAGPKYSSAIKTDGTIWSWGYNAYGQLGLGNNTTTINPTQVGTANDWEQISTNGYHAVALKYNGNLWAWGDNEFGELGNGTINSTTSPIFIACQNLDAVNFEKRDLITTVYPNPVNDILNISSDQKIISITVFNASGQLIITKVINDKKTAIDVSGLLSGVYTVKIDAGDKNVKTVKVIKR